MAAAVAKEEAVFCSNMMTQIAFGANSRSVPLYIDNTAAIHAIGNRTYSARTKHVALRYFYIDELVKEGDISICYVPTEQQLAGIDTKHLKKQRHRFTNPVKNF